MFVDIARLWKAVSKLFIKAGDTKNIEYINSLYSKYYDGYEFSDRFKDVSLRRFLNSLPIHDVEESE